MPTHPNANTPANTPSSTPPTGPAPRGDSPSRAPLVLGIIALTASAITPAWALLAFITGGLEAAAWVPVIVFFSPFALIFLALLLVAAIGGITAARRSGTNRTLGRIALALAAAQLLAAFSYLLWSLTDIMNG